MQLKEVAKAYKKTEMFGAAETKDPETVVVLVMEELIKSVTKSWEGKRDKNYRPLVSKDILKRMKLVTTEEAWGTCRKNGYHFQFAGDWNNLHPERVIVGRAVTCRWVPKRPDLNDAIESQGEIEKRIGFQNSWVIDELKEDDLIVVDLFGKIFDGTFAGDNLTTAIKSKTGTGMVIDGGIRDTQRIFDMEDFNAFVRGFDPSAINDLSMPEINGVTRIGNATCLPGDVVLGTRSGVILTFFGSKITFLFVSEIFFFIISLNLLVSIPK